MLKQKLGTLASENGVIYVMGVQNRGGLGPGI